MLTTRRMARIVVTVILLASLASPGLAAASGPADEENAFAFSGGTGTVSDPYLLSSAKDLFDFAQALNTDHSGYQGECYKLTSDIDLGQNTWVPAGKQGHGFCGTFDGNGKTISLRKIAPGEHMGFFEDLTDESLVKNLVVKGDIRETVNLEGRLYFGLIAAICGGTLENCIARGTIDLTVNSGDEICLGSMVGANIGTMRSVMNEGDLTVRFSSGSESFIGGLAGELRGRDSLLEKGTNKGSITVVSDGFFAIGGVAGGARFGASPKNLLNTGNLHLEVARLEERTQGLIGGVLGNLHDATLDRALNKGNITVEAPEPSSKSEIAIGGIVGGSQEGVMKNVGNEGNLESNSMIETHVNGVCFRRGDSSLDNGYSTGRYHAYSPSSGTNVYSNGLGEGIAGNNYYYSGLATIEAGYLGEVPGDAISNIRPGDQGVELYNYCYWNPAMLPFPGPEGFHKIPSTCKAFDVSTGRLASPVTVGGKSYSLLSEALNAWVSVQGGDYLGWTGGANPVLDWTFGYTVPDYTKYKNAREGKWLNASDWAYQWLDKADKEGIIPDSLLDRDMELKISRKEFAHVAVKLYEKLKGVSVELKINNPFRDTDDREVTKAYQLDIIRGVGDNRFAPKEDLTREQAATMLTRVYKAVYWDGWTLDQDNEYDKETLDTQGALPFKDDDLISDYAKDSVYFMVKHSIIGGVGDNTFAPSPLQSKLGDYGLATREQAFKIAVAMLEEFKK